MGYLESLGFSLSRAKGCPSKFMGSGLLLGSICLFSYASVTERQILDGRTLQPTTVISMDVVAASFYRPDLRKELKHLAEETDGPGPPCRLVGLTSAICVDPDQGVVQLADGSREVADLVVAADGVHSSASMSHVLYVPVGLLGACNFHWLL